MVTLPYTENLYRELNELAAVTYWLPNKGAKLQGVELSGGDECARNDWMIFLVKKDAR